MAHGRQHFVADQFLAIGRQAEQSEYFGGRENAGQRGADDAERPPRITVFDHQLSQLTVGESVAGLVRVRAQKQLGKGGFVELAVLTEDARFEAVLAARDGRNRNAK